MLNVLIDAGLFANSKAWETMEITTLVLRRLNEKLKRRKQNIFLFLYNAPCHPPSLADKFSNISIKFLPGMATSLCMVQGGYLNKCIRCGQVHRSFHGHCMGLTSMRRSVSRNNKGMLQENVALPRGTWRRG